MESIQKSHYRRRLEYLDGLSSEEFTNEISDIFRERWAWLESHIASGAQISDHTTDSKKLNQFVRSNSLFLGNAYLVKSASLLDGFVWSTNQSNIYGMSLFLRNEIEVLAISHYAATLFEGRDAFEGITLLMR
ncbi:MAG: hypothetical protein ABI623_13125, partial [bacterium]